MSHHTIINNAWWCYRHVLAYKSCSPDVGGRAGIVNHIIVKIVNHISIAIFVKIIAKGFVFFHIVQTY